MTKSRFIRMHWVSFVAALSLCVAPLVLSSAKAKDAEKPPVRIGFDHSSSDVGFYVADKKGYFKEEGISVVFIPFDTAGQMIAPLGTGQLDVGSGSVSAGLYNAVGRGIDVKVVADGGNAPPGYGHNLLLVRTELIKSGRYKSLSDLKGMTIAITSEGASSAAMLNSALIKAGLKYGDVKTVSLGYPDHVIALTNGKVDAAFTAEPAATQALRNGSATAVATDAVVDPYREASDVLYSGDFIKKDPARALAFMRAFIRGERFYNDALKDGKLAGPNAEEVIQILTASTNIKDPALYRAINPQGADPDGKLNMQSLSKDFEFYKSRGLITTHINVEQVVDQSIVQKAVEGLGPYKPLQK